MAEAAADQWPDPARSLSHQRAHDDRGNPDVPFVYADAWADAPKFASFAHIRMKVSEQR